MKRIIFLFLLLGIFCFSNTGFKNVEWGMSQEEVISKVKGTYRIGNGEVLYKNILFSNVKMESVMFYFADGKLNSWVGMTECTQNEFKNLISNYESKYGKLEKEVTSKRESYIKNNSKSMVSCAVKIGEATTQSKIAISIGYYDPKYYN